MSYYQQKTVFYLYKKQPTDNNVQTASRWPQAFYNLLGLTRRWLAKSFCEGVFTWHQRDFGAVRSSLRYPVPSCGSVLVYMIPPQNVMRVQVHPGCKIFLLMDQNG